jgi:hypothetical protein
MIVMPSSRSGNNKTDAYVVIVVVCNFDRT